MKCKVVMPDYRLLPKYRYPIAIEDCYNTYMWVLENAESMKIKKE
nr:alpha/beta hydrolase fold domain-containing protein [uncultured Treponema sp.]